MSIKEKFEKMRGMGHNIPAGLDEILNDLDKRISALEPKAKEDPKPNEQAKSDEYKLMPTPVTLTKVGTDNPT